MQPIDRSDQVPPKKTKHVLYVRERRGGGGGKRKETRGYRLTNIYRFLAGRFVGDIQVLARARMKQGEAGQGDLSSPLPSPLSPLPSPLSPLPSPLSLSLSPYTHPHNRGGHGVDGEVHRQGPECCHRLCNLKRYFSFFILNYLLFYFILFYFILSYCSLLLFYDILFIYLVQANTSDVWSNKNRTT